MIITFGISFVGKVDRVPGRCYVVTEVFQVVMVPLIPIRGHLVREGTETETFVSGLQKFEGTHIPISWKSFGWAWIRVLLFAGALIQLPMIIGHKLGVPPGLHNLILMPGLPILMLIAWWKTRRGLRAKPERAREVEMQLDAPTIPTATARQSSGRTSSRAR
jgi:hypothetical protein